MTTQDPVRPKLSELEDKVEGTQRSLATAGLALTNPSNCSWDTGCKAYAGYMSALGTHNTAVATFRAEVNRLVDRPAKLVDGVLYPFDADSTNNNSKGTSDGSESGGSGESAGPNAGSSDSSPSPADPSSPTAPTPTPSSRQVSNITQYQPKVVTKYGGGDVTVSFDNTKNMWVAKWKRPDMNESFVVFESNAGRRLTGADFTEGTLGRKNLDAAVVRYRRENKEVPSLPSTKPSPTARDIVVAGKDGLQLTPESLDERKFVGVPDGRQVLVGRLKNSKHWFVLTPGDEGFKYYQVGEKRPSDDEIRAKILGGGFTKAWGPENSIVSGRFPRSGTIANVPLEKVRIESGSNGLIVASPETLDPASRRYVGLTSGAGYRVLVGSVTGSTGAKVWFSLTPKEGGGFQSYQLVPGSGQNGYDRAREMLENGSFSQVWDAAGNVTKFTKSRS